MTQKLYSLGVDIPGSCLLSLNTTIRLEISLSQTEQNKILDGHD